LIYDWKHFKPGRLENLPGFVFLPNPIKFIQLSYWKAIFVIFATLAEAFWRRRASPVAALALAGIINRFRSSVG
jgi:hypothetical protein